jgi:hypothetical protein
MPLARIDLPACRPADYGRAVADVVYEAMIATLNAPKNEPRRGEEGELVLRQRRRAIRLNARCEKRQLLFRTLVPALSEAP